MSLDLSHILDGPGRYLYQGPWPTVEHWQNLRARADKLGRPLCIVNMHWQPEVPPPEHWRTADQILWLNAEDGPFQRLDLCWVRMVGRQVAQPVEAGFLTYVHCLAGVSRSTLAVVACLASLEGQSGPDALRFVKERRAIAGPNPAFLGLINALGRRA